MELGIPIIEGSPPPGSVKTSIAEAERMLGFHLYRPRVSGTPEIESVWASVRNGSAAIFYSSGMSIFLVREAPPADVRGRYEALAEQLAPAAAVMTVRGGPALVTMQNTPGNGCDGGSEWCIPSQENPGSVSLWIGNIDITLYAHLPPGDLVRLAESIR